jgi:hypothetical protein
MIDINNPEAAEIIKAAWAAFHSIANPAKEAREKAFIAAHKEYESALKTAQGRYAATVNPALEDLKAARKVAYAKRFGNLKESNQ